MNKENTGVIYTAIICLGLIALILWSFFNAAFGNEMPEKQKEISVILYSAGTGGWESFQEGIKQAEDDFSVNINFVTLREEAGAEEQLETMKREVQEGAEALVIAVVDYQKLYELILLESFEVPMVAVESGFNDEVIPLISSNNYEMGKKLGEEILKDFSDEEQLTVAVDEETVLRDSIKKRQEGLLDALEGKANMIPLTTAFDGAKIDAAVALHKEALLELSESKAQMIEDVKCYGIGNTSSIVAALDQGRIEKLVFQNEFNMGYLAVKTVLEKINGIQSAENEYIDYYCVSGKELYGTQYEQLLFPIVE